MELELTDRVIMVTGCDGPVGLAISRALLREEACVVAVTRDPSATSEALEEPAEAESPGGTPGHLIIEEADVLSQGSVQSCVQHVARTTGRLDSLVCATVAPVCSTPEYRDERSNLDSLVGLAHQRLTAIINPLVSALPLLKSATNPRAVLVHVRGQGPAPLEGLNLARSLSIDLGPDNVEIHSLVVESLGETLAYGSPLARSIAKTAAFLLSPETGYLSGCVIPVNNQNSGGSLE